MAEKYEEIANAILNIWQGQESESERKELEQWLNSSEENRSWLERMEDDDVFYQDFSQFNNSNLEESERILWQRINDYENGKLKARHQYFTMRKVVGWAAILVVVVGLSYLLFNSFNNESTSAGEQAGTDKNKQVAAAADTTKILLTLADGSQHIVNQEEKDQTVSAKYGVFIVDRKLVFKRPVGYKRKEKSPFHKLIIPKGGFYQLTLPDSSNVWLNSASSIVFPASDTGNTRNVTITGEAYLEVKKDSTRPFYVNLPGGNSIEVLGTTFTVNTYPDEPFIGMTLISGEVIVKRADQEKRIKTGQQAQIFESTIKVEDSIDIRRYTAWKDGDFYFKRDSLTTVIRQLARWYNKQVHYIDTPSIIVTYIDKRSHEIDATLEGLKDGNSKIQITLSKNKDTLIINR